MITLAIWLTRHVEETPIVDNQLGRLATLKAHKQLRQKHQKMPIKVGINNGSCGVVF